MRDTIPIPGFAEPISSLTHLLGAIIFAAASWWLLRRGRGDKARMFSLVVFCTGAVFLLSMSGIYHQLPAGPMREFARRLDHVGIFLLIAASFSPAHVILFRGWQRTGPLVVIWSVAIIGIALKMIYFYEMPTWMGLGLYLGMGWLGVFSSFTLWRKYGLNFVQPLIWGGLAYTVGCTIEGLQWPILITGVVQWHEILHVTVLIGLSCHWAFIYQIADGHVELS